MSRVSGISAGGLVGARAKQAAAPGGFAVESHDPAAATAAAPPPQPALAAMLALQEAETETAANLNGKRHGLAVLDALQELQRALLAPGDGEPQLDALKRLASYTPAVADGRMADVLSAIRLRAKIELLRRAAPSS